MRDTEHSPEVHIPLPGLLEVARRTLLAEFERDLAENGYGDIRPTHGCVFRFVHDDGMRLTDLAALASMTKQSVGELVDDLCKLGYVERVPDPADGRAKLIRLTDRGVEAQRVGFALFDRLEERWAERFGPERVAVLRATLEEIVYTEAPDAVPELARPEPAAA
jgi:DNA-binding MarR family transcriptional regulator